MLSEAQRFWEAIAGKVKQTAKEVSKNAFRCERYTVTTAPNGVKMGVTLPMGNTELMLPYSSEVASATVGDTVLVVWWGSMSNAKVYYYADGYNGVDINSVVTSVNGQTGAVSIDPERIGAMSEWDLLWENASPTSSFAGQTILTSGLSAYDMVAIQIIYSGSFTHTTTAFSPINGESLDISVVSSDNQRIACGYRIATVAITGIVFSDGAFIGSSSNRTTNNSYGIPQRVWGLKGVNNS